MDQDFIDRTKALAQGVDALHFSFDGVIYNPLDYALELHLAYQEMALSGSNKILFLGMNPGPDGMVQIGVPFGARSLVRDYLGISGEVGRPDVEHPKRPVTGFAGKKDEGSGKAFWSMVRSVYPNKSDFFARCTVQNFCPLCFITLGERTVNVTPDKLERKERAALEALCLDYLGYIMERFTVKRAVAIGNYAYSQLVKFPGLDVVKIMHPSPINPSAHKAWADNGRLVADCLREEGIFI